MSQSYEHTQYTGQKGPMTHTYATVPATQPATSFYQPQNSNPTIVAGNYAAINGSFEYNAGRIPGLGMGTAAANPRMTSPYHMEKSVVPPKDSYGSLSSLYRDQNVGMVSLQERNQSYDHMNNAVKPLITQTNDFSEEGELSEGELEDLYEPRGPHNDSSIPSQRLKMLVRAREDQSGSVGDADGSSIYDSPSTREEVVIDSTSASIPAIDEEEEEEEDYEPGEYEAQERPRDHSRSYSPHLSPVEQRNEAFAKRLSPEARNLAAPSRTPPPPSGYSNTVGPPPDGTVLPNGQTPRAQSQAGLLGNSSNPPTDSVESKLPYKSVTDAKKKAQEAILGLWPYKVRYQNYLDEGLDPQLVKSLFTELGLDISSAQPPAAAPKSSLATHPTAVSSSSLAAEPIKQVDSLALTIPPISSAAQLHVQTSKSGSDKPATGSGSKMAEKKSAHEERKDKIARMLAEKKKKSLVVPVATPPTNTPTNAPTHAPVPTTAPPSESAPALAPAPSPAPVAPVPSKATSSMADQGDALKAKVRAAKNQKILEKMAALKKQRESKPDSVTKSVTDNIILVVEPESTSQPAAHVASLERATAPPVNNPDLSVSSSPQPTPQNRAVKRPVASDFDTYSTNGSALKRTRTQETLIIDVSDDEDVEMDLGSPTEAPTTAAQNNGVLARQTSLASFGPLTNSRTWRGQKSTPGTPAVGTPSGEHGHKLDYLTQRIEEAKKKIAEAEAKKKVLKKPNGLSTPMTQSPTPASGHIELSRLPKPAEATRSPKIERRDRIASYHLPVADAALTEKRERLQRLQAEAMKLELEVQADLADRQRLADEMETLDKHGESESELSRPSGKLEDSQSGTIVDAQITAPTVDESTATDSQISVASAQLAQQAPVIQEETPSNKETRMDVDSDFSGSGANVDPVISETNIATLAESSNTTTSSLSVSPAASPFVDVVPEANPAVAANTDRSNLADETSDPGDGSPADADVPMQISDVEEDDSYEPLPGPISGTDKVRRAKGDKEDEIPDEEPYEPSPAQIAVTSSETVPGTSIDEVQLRSSREPRLLTKLQTKAPNKILARDLLTYESPLRYFHAYRFHPKFLENVSGGLKSMTYSSKIDCNRPVCPFLIDNGQCPRGGDCEFQHFASMALSDTAIIAQLGSTDMYEGEEKGRFIEGLKKVLQDLKANKVKDFDSITKAIVRYRADFLGDTSKVLALNNVAI